MNEGSFCARSIPRERSFISSFTPPHKAEAEALLGWPLDSADWLGYLEATGRGLGGVPR